jgi:hypothetical protein
MIAPATVESHHVLTGKPILLPVDEDAKKPAFSGLSFAANLSKIFFSTLLTLVSA